MKKTRNSLYYTQKILLIFLCLTNFFFYNITSHAEDIYLIPSGKAVGIKLYTQGLLVIGTDKVTSSDGKLTSPAIDSGIRKNDVILKANNIELSEIEQLSEIVQAHKDGLTLTVQRKNNLIDTAVFPVISEDGSAKLGLWVRDSTAGIGTVTYINPADNTFAALGHGVCDPDTDNILSVKSGSILNCSFLSVTKGKKGAPGELGGAFERTEIGNIFKNTNCGIFGKITQEKAFSFSDAVPAASAMQVEEGKAYIVSETDTSGSEQYEIEIKHLFPNNDTKGIVFEVKDKSLLEKTGGIIQGMSGSPIIQNGKIIGAVTHVCVNL